jgi:aspartokinase/homoserine dehydrogenase 1
VNVLHEAFFESTYKQLNIFVIGVGNVGSKLLSQLKQQQPFLSDHLNLQTRITGIANSKKMLFVDNGNDINLENWKDQLQNGESMQLEKFVDTIIEKNLRNSVFVDVTADENVATVYDKLLSKAVSVVACNKIAASSSYQKLCSFKIFGERIQRLISF